MPRIEIPFVGASYDGRSPAITAQSCINLYPEKNPDGSATPSALIGTPGLSTFCDTGTTSPILGMIVAGDYLYAVTNSTLYQINTSGVATSKGTLSSTTDPVSMAWNGTQLIVINTANGYTYTPGTDTFAVISDSDFVAMKTICFLNGRFIGNKIDSGRFYWSALYDGTSWTALGYATAEGDPDALIAVGALKRELWLFGETTTEVWAAGRTTTAPFVRRQDAAINIGCSAPFSVASDDKNWFWVGSSARGDNVVYSTNGYNPVRISTNQIEYRLGTYSTVEDAIGYVYQEEGHTFYVLTFPTGNATWVYDTLTALWHERRSEYLDNISNAQGRHRSNCHAFFDRKHLVGDYETGLIYQQALDTYTEGTCAIRRVRRCQTLANLQKRLFFADLQVLFQHGVGLATGQGDDPEAMLRWSNDGGQTWSNEVWVNIGKAGETRARAIWRRLGTGRNRVFELAITDPIKVVVLGAWSNVTEGLS